MPESTHIIAGKKIVTYTSTFPARRYWYSHSKVEANGMVLDGFIQTTCKFGRVETITCFRDSCVLGTHIEWLKRMNGVS